MDSLKPAKSYVLSPWTLHRLPWLLAQSYVCCVFLVHFGALLLGITDESDVFSDTIIKVSTYRSLGDEAASLYLSMRRGITAAKFCFEMVSRRTWASAFY